MHILLFSPLTISTTAFGSFKELKETSDKSYTQMTPVLANSSYLNHLNDCNCGLCELNVNSKAFSNVNKASQSQ